MIALQGTSGSLAHNLQLSLAVAAAPPPPDFSLSVVPASLTLQAGGSAQPFTVSATALNGFTGTIDVTLSGLPNGVAAAPATFTLTPGTPQQISLNAGSTTPGGSSTLTVSAVSGSISHSAPLQITVQPVAPDFSLSLSPATISLTVGGAAQQVSITANAVGAFNSPVNITLTGLPAGVTATPSTLTLTPGSAQSISLQASSTAAAGDSSVTVQGTSGSLTHSAALPLTLTAPAPDFQLFAGTLDGESFDDCRPASDDCTHSAEWLRRCRNRNYLRIASRRQFCEPPLPLIANLPQSMVVSAAEPRRARGRLR